MPAFVAVVAVVAVVALDAFPAKLAAVNVSVFGFHVNVVESTFNDWNPVVDETNVG